MGNWESSSASWLEQRYDPRFMRETRKTSLVVPSTTNETCAEAIKRDVLINECPRGSCWRFNQLSCFILFQWFSFDPGILVRFVETSSLPLVDLVINFCCRETCEKTMLLERLSKLSKNRYLRFIGRMNMARPDWKVWRTCNIFVELSISMSLDASQRAILLVRSEYSTSWKIVVTRSIYDT